MLKFTTDRCIVYSDKLNTIYSSKTDSFRFRIVLSIKLNNKNKSKGNSACHMKGVVLF